LLETARIVGAFERVEHPEEVEGARETDFRLPTPD